MSSLWWKFRNWIVLLALKFAYTFPKAFQPRRAIHYLGLFLFRARSDWIHPEGNGYWVVEDVKKNAKREELNDRISDADVIFLWIPGGGFRFDLGKLYVPTFATWMRALEADKSIKSMFYVANYSHGPESLFPAAIKEVADTYNWLITSLGINPNKIIIGADDAGVAIALDALLLKIDPSTKPAAMICVCPYTGLEAGGESWRDNLGKDILNENSMTRMEECYLGPEDSEYEGGLSPFTYLDKSMVIGSFVPKRMLVYLGGKQVLLEEGGILASRAGSSGVQVMVVQEPSGIHLWPMFANDLVEDINVRQNAVDKLVEFVSSIYYSEAKHKRK